jgi:hypothetical protein
VRWLNPTTDEGPAGAPFGGAFARSRRLVLAHVDGHELRSWPLDSVVRREGQAFRVTHHRGVPPAPGQLDWTFDVWGVEVR